MTKASANVFPKLIGAEGAAPGTPAAATAILYVKADGLWYSKDDAGVETLVSGGLGGGIPAALLDAKGDLIAASAADTAARLAAAANGAALITASGESTGLKWRLNNDGAAVAPTVNEDSGDGYSVGSRWIDTTADKEYVCLDATAGAAAWVETTQAGGSSSLGLKVVLSHSAAINLNDGTDTTLTWNTDDYDPDAWHDPGSNPTRCTAPSGTNLWYRVGYHLTVTASLSATPANLHFVYLLVGGATNKGLVHFEPNDSGSFVSGAFAPIQLSSTNWIELIVKVVGASKQSTVTGAYAPRLWIERVA